MQIGMGALACPVVPSGGRACLGQGVGNRRQDHPQPERLPARLETETIPNGGEVILVDKYGHMVSDSSTDELHCFAVAIGLKRDWFQNHPRHPHYDLTTRRKLELALRRGATLVNSRDLIHSLIDLRRLYPPRSARAERILRRACHPGIRVMQNEDV